MPKYVIERNIPGAGSLSSDQLCATSKLSNEVIASLGSRVQWQHSYVTTDKIYCVYIADNEEVLREHARQVGLPADVISEVGQIIDPTTGES